MFGPRGFKKWNFCAKSAKKWQKCHQLSTKQNNKLNFVSDLMNHVQKSQLNKCNTTCSYEKEGKITAILDCLSIKKICSCWTTENKTICEKNERNGTSVLNFNVLLHLYPAFISINGNNRQKRQQQPNSLTISRSYA